MTGKFQLLMRWAGSAAFLTLAACSTDRGPGRGSETAGPASVFLKSDGLGVAGTGLEIGFGRAEKGAVAAAVKALGTKPIERVPTAGCRGATLQAYRWADGLLLAFRNGEFVGWQAASDGITTANGLSAGASQAVVASLPGARLSGDGFQVGGISGRFGADGAVASLWAGDICAG